MSSINERLCGMLGNGLKSDIPGSRDVSARLKKINRVFDRTIWVFAYGSVILIAFMMLSISLNIGLGYFANAPIRWITEVAMYSLLWIVFLGTAWVLKEEGHVRMDLLVSHLNPRARSIVNFGTSVLGAVACLVFTWYSVKSFSYYFQMDYVVDSMMAPRKWQIMLVIPPGSLLLFLQFVRSACVHFAQWRASVAGSLLPNCEVNRVRERWTGR